jgi:hypothetical protein
LTFVAPWTREVEMALDGLLFHWDGLIAESSIICAVYGREFLRQE